MGGQRGGTQRGGRVGAHQQGGPQGHRTHHERQPGAGGPPYAGEVRTQPGSLPAGGPHDHDDQCRGRSQLGEVGADRGPGYAQAEPVDRQHVETDVGQVADDRDQQRGPGVLQAAQDAGPGQHHQQWHDSEEGPPQVRRGLPRDRGVRAEEPDQPGGQQQSCDRGDRPDQDREPDPVETLGERPGPVAGTDAAGHRRGGAVGEEDAQAHCSLQHGRGDSQPGELGGAKVADDRGVRQQEHRLGHQGEEGRYGEPQDLAVVGPGPGGRHRDSVAAVTPAAGASLRPAHRRLRLRRRVRVRSKGIYDVTNL